jgi:hypothetical protein
VVTNQDDNRYRIWFLILEIELGFELSVPYETRLSALVLSGRLCQLHDTSNKVERRVVTYLKDTTCSFSTADRGIEPYLDTL